MPLIVEDGTCPENANSYVSLECADAYLVPRGLWPLYESKADNMPEEGNGSNEDDKEPEQPDAPIEPAEPEEGENEPQELSELPESPEEEAGEMGDNGEPEGGGDEPESPEPDPELPDNPDAGTELPDTSKPDDDPEIAKREAALMRAFDYLNGPLKWKGQKVCWDRIPAWPRVNVPIPGTDTGTCKPQYIEDNFIPEAVCRAQMELAAFIYNGRDLFAPLERGGKYQQKSDSKSETVDVLSESESHSIAYADNAPIEDWLPSVYSLLRPFLEEVPGEVANGFTVHNILRG